MIKCLKYSLICMLLPMVLKAQNTMDSVVINVAKNNTSLIAFRSNIDAKKFENKTGIFLQNPEVEYSYFWGNPSNLGNRTDISVMQSFDFPSAYIHKSSVSKLKNEQAEMEYVKQLKSVMLETRLLCVDIIFKNVMKNELLKRLTHAENVAKAFKQKLDVGDVNIIEYNNAQLNLLKIKKQVEVLEIERNELLSNLAVLNGGKALELNDTTYQIISIPENFEQWYVSVEANNPLLKWVKQEIDIQKKQIQVNRAMSFPKLKAGYVSEENGDQKFKGFSVGLTIPLWENKNTVKFAKANLFAAQNTEADYKLQYYNRLKSLHAKAISLQKSIEDYKNQISMVNNAGLLQKALEKGEINLLNYILESSVYYESINTLIELERDYYKVMAELKNEVM